MSAVAFCFLPYFTSSLRLHALLDGLVAIVNFPQAGLSSIMSRQGGHLEASTTYLIIFLALMMMPFLTGRENTAGRKLLYLSLLGSVALELSFLVTHYYWHYIIMFVTYIAPAAYINVRAIINNDDGVGVIKKLFSCLLISLIAYKFSSYSVPFLKKTIMRPRISFNINDREIDHSLLDFLRNVKSSGHSFLVVTKPYYHALLDESRIGDGNSVMIYFVLRGYKLPQVSNIYLLSKQVQRQPCLALLNSNKDIFVIKKKNGMSKLLSRCFANSRITLDKHVPPDLEEYDIYIRRRWR